MLKSKLQHVFNAVAREFAENLPRDVLSTTCAAGAAAILGFAPAGAVAAGWAAGVAAYRLADGVYIGLKNERDTAFLGKPVLK